MLGCSDWRSTGSHRAAFPGMFAGVATYPPNFAVWLFPHSTLQQVSYRRLIFSFLCLSEELVVSGCTITAACVQSMGFTAVFTSIIHVDGDSGN